jgi:molecular chaperone DnaK (HSP70)
MIDYAVGIDLGTTNTVLSYAPLSFDDAAARITVLPIEQLFDVGALGEKLQLPSFTYLPGAHDLSPGATRLPWNAEGEETGYLVGEAAKRQGARVSMRLLSSAKSWLCHPGVDRTAPILPWGAPDEVLKISPVEASSRYLSHISTVFYRATQRHLAEQEVVLCVPASFDDVARALTVKAARAAGLTRVTLLEEPQAAFYDFVSAHRANLKETLKDIQLVLIVDVGGGTTDLTLIEVSPETKDSNVKLTRVAVGDHLMLGGDNMDQALARALEPSLGGAALSQAEWSELCHACRGAKERLFSDNPPDEFSVSLAAKGAKLIGGTRRASITREQAKALLLDGFFPNTNSDELPRQKKSGLKELGLPYVQDAAIPRHIAAFLARHKNARPDAILLNGGALTPSVIANRLLNTMSHWRGDPVVQLPSASLDLAVAKGATYYALAKLGRGLRIGGGAARAYYVGLDTPTGKAALCVIPRRFDSTDEVEVSSREFLLRVGSPVRFPFFASSADLGHRVGDLIALQEELTEMSPIETALKDDKGARDVPVKLHAQMSEVGTLSLFLVGSEQEQRFKLEFNLRAQNNPSAPVPEENTVAPSKVKDAKEQIELIFGKKPREVNTNITALTKNIEKIIGKTRDEWPTTLLRDLFDQLALGMNQRNRSTDHHSAWLNLAGFALRPGFGYPLDEERLQKIIPLFPQGPQFRQEKRSWVEWWIFWRRISGGLPGSQQEAFFQSCMTLLRKTGQKAPEGLDEMLRLMATLERVEPGKKRALGEDLLSRMERGGISSHLAWSLGRVGSRVLFHGGAEWVIPGQYINDWLTRFMALSWRGLEDASFCATLLARKTGDRNRDIDPKLVQQVAQQLRANKAPTHWVDMVTTLVAQTAQDTRRLFGESLPVGLRLAE